MTGPLQDLAVLECGTRLSVGMCGKLLSDLGARVTKVEPIDGDPARRAGPFPGDVPHHEQSGLFAYLHRGKQSVTIDLETTAGRAAVHRLAAGFDIVIAGGTYAELERWRLLHDALAEANHRLICTAITPFGLTGPRRDQLESEIVVTALSGNGYYIPTPVESPSTPPSMPGAHLADFCAGVQAANATMMAVTGRGSSGVGLQVDVSEQETFLDSLRIYFSTYVYKGAVHPRDRANIAPAMRGQSGKCRDGYIASVPGPQSDDRAWRSLVDAMGNPEWAAGVEMLDQGYRQAHATEIMERINAWTESMSKHEVARLMQERHIPCLPFNDVDELLVNEQLASRNYFMPLAQPGLEQARVPSSPIRFDGAPIRVTGRAPFLGEHNREAMAAAGFSAADIAWFDRSNVM